MEEKIRVVIADDHTMVRTGIRSWLEAEADIVVVGEAGTGKEAVRLTLELKPDVLLQDLQMPDMSGLDVIRVVRKELPTAQILALTGHDTHRVKAVLDAGCVGYLTKEERRELIIEAVRWAARRERGVWVSPSVMTDMVKTESAIKDAQLTKAELTVLRHIEHSNGEIAATLHLSEGTIKNHISSIYDKLGVKSRLEAARWAREAGVIE
jgi:DNA-binding NarL/FixJ family response regulator